MIDDSEKALAERNPRATLQRIRWAAVSEFGSVGLGRSNVDHIARLAGVTKQLVYHYFPRKGELYDEAVNSFAHSFFTDLLAAELEHDDPREAIRDFAHRLADFYTSNPAITGLVIDQSLQQGATFKGSTAVMRLRAQLLDRLGVALARGVAQNRFDPAISASGLFLMSVVVAVGYVAIGGLRSSFLLPVLELDSGQKLNDIIVGQILKGVSLPAAG